MDRLDILVNIPKSGANWTCKKTLNTQEQAKKENTKETQCFHCRDCIGQQESVGEWVWQRD